MNRYSAASLGLALAGAALLGYAGYVWADAAVYQNRAEAQLHGGLTPPARAPAVPAGTAPGDVVGEIAISRLGLRAMVLEGDSEAILRRGAGHVPGTALPGEIGNVAVAAHRDSFFRPLKDIQTGDLIQLTTLATSVEYQVTSTSIVAPDDVAVLNPTPAATLTLITCYPFYYVGPAPSRFIVRATAIRQP